MKTHFIIKRFLLGLALLASCDFGAFAKVVLPVLVSDGMVLQRNAPLTSVAAKCSVNNMG